MREFHFILIELRRIAVQPELIYTGPPSNADAMRLDFESFALNFHFIESFISLSVYGGPLRLYTLSHSFFILVASPALGIN